MKKLGVLCLVALFVVLSGGPDAYGQKKMKKEPILWAAEDIKWETMKNGPQGAMVAILWGNIGKGAYGAMVKLPAGFVTPLHTHSHDLKTVIVSGTMIHTPEGGTEKSYGTGSYLYIPSTEKHTTRIGADAPCVLFQESSGMFDLKPVAEKK